MEQKGKMVCMNLLSLTLTWFPQVHIMDFDSACFRFSDKFKNIKNRV